MATPRCWYAFAVTHRPRGVRVRKPICIRYGSYTSSSVTASTVATSLNNLINALKGYGLIS